MDDRRISHGLALLADEVEPPAVDVHAVIATARARNRNRKLVGATAVGTMAVVGALAVTIGFTGPEPAAVTPATQQTTTAPPAPETPVDPVFDERAARFTEAVSAVMGSVAQPNVEISGLNHGQQGLGVPVFQGFQRDGRDPSYQGVVDLTTADAAAELAIWVVREEPGLPEPGGTPTGPCASEQPACSTDELADGTVVTALADGEQYVIFAKRPDGTVVEIRVAAKTAGVSLERLIQLDKLDLIVDAITY